MTENTTATLFRDRLPPTYTLCQSKFSCVLFEEWHRMFAATDTALVVMGMLCDGSSSVTVPGKSAWVTGHHLYREVGPRDVMSGEVAHLLNQNWWLHLM